MKNKIFKIFSVILLIALLTDIFMIIWDIGNNWNKQVLLTIILVWFVRRIMEDIL